MINNRQGGRRRGRGGQGGRNLGGQPGNRQDNRQRGNAAQLLEKYKSLARDAQLAGDRVQTEYYLQYADHYFRVLGESRARFEDQRPRRDADGEDHEDEMAEAAEEQGSGEDEQHEPRRERFKPRDRDRDQDRDRSRRPARNEPSDDGRDEGREQSRLNGTDDSLPLDVLPPAIGADGPVTTADSDEPEPVEERRPRRRARSSRPVDGDDEATPAA